MSDPLLPLLQCPSCRRGVPAAVDGGYACSACGATFPRLDGIAWLFPDAPAALAEWRNRTTLYLEEFDAERRRAAADLESIEAGSTGAARVRRLATAYADHSALVRSLLAPLATAAGAMPHATQVAFGTELPPTQDLHSYHANAHRDWAWGDAENEASHALVADALGPGRTSVLVLGAGAGRLAYDLHDRGDATTTVALDLNPLLLTVGSRAARGEGSELYEFPLAPKDADSVAIRRRLVAPRPSRDGLVFVCADAWRAPFPAQSFDAVVTPWLVDIVDLPFPDVAAHVNRLLRPGGRWVNFGSLSFAARRPALRWSGAEVLEIVAASGFEVRATSDTALPYLSSPASRHARVETVALFAADKVRRGPREASPPLPPPWLIDTSLPVPRTDDLELAGTASRIQAILLALFDGSRSIDDVVRVVVEQGLLERTQALAATRGLLDRLHANAHGSGARVT
jgi:SAM-dependent methyltransferase